MAGRHLPIRDPDGGPGKPERGRAEIARRGPGATPVYAAGELDFVPADRSREELWQALGAQVHERVNGKLGTLVEWWATEDDGQISAALLGDRAFVVVTPTINRHGGPAYRIRSRRLAAASFRSARIVESPGENPTGPASGRGGSAASPPGASGPQRLEARLGPGMTGFLGHLPAKAQRLLQDPFITIGARHELHSDYHCLRFGNTRGFGGSTLHFWCYLIDAQVITFAAGVGHGFDGARQPAAWTLTCWHARLDSGTPKRDLTPRSPGSGV